LKFQFTSDKWTAMLNGESFSTGTIEVENTNDGAILNLKQTHIWPGAVAGKAVGKLASKVPGGAVAGSALNAAGGLAGAVEASGPVIVLGYKAGPPAGLSYLRSTGATPAASPERNIFGEMIQINGGTFTMGSPENEPGRSNNEGPQRQVTVSSFLMGKYPITQKAYQQVMGTKPSKFKGDDLPVERVSWFDALWFCNELSMKEGLSPVYRIGSTVEIIAGSNGYRLPTEAEWEYACRAGTTTPFSTGNNITTNQANYNGNSPYNTNAKGENRKKTTPVARFFGNAWGLYDMHGNVAEWCWDRSGNYPSGEQMDPMGASSGNNRVIRGGSWFDGGQSVRSAYRQGMSPNGKNDVTGFRVARSL
jgi:formylglycine-generating enzyme required for sulfatase activity